MVSLLTIVMAVYGQPKILSHQLETISAYPKEILERLSVRIVDDHGDPPARLPAGLRDQLDIKLFRVQEDIPWNQMGARNWGMHHAPDGWCVMLDPDMVIEPDMIIRFVDRVGTLQRGTVVKFGLRHVDGKSSGKSFTKGINFSSPNTWFIHKQDFFDVGGYDEEFRGNKGWSDCFLQEFLKSHYRVVEDPKLFVSFHTNGTGFDDAVVTSIDRCTKHNRALKIRKNRLVRQMRGHKRYLATGCKGPILLTKLVEVTDD